MSPTNNPDIHICHRLLAAANKAGLKLTSCQVESTMSRADPSTTYSSLPDGRFVRIDWESQPSIQNLNQLNYVLKELAAGGTVPCTADDLFAQLEIMSYGVQWRAMLRATAEILSENHVAAASVGLELFKKAKSK